jgi:hypothetical protein
MSNIMTAQRCIPQRPQLPYARQFCCERNFWHARVTLTRLRIGKSGSLFALRGKVNPTREFTIFQKVLVRRFVIRDP